MHSEKVRRIATEIRDAVPDVEGVNYETLVACLVAMKIANESDIGPLVPTLMDRMTDPFQKLNPNTHRERVLLAFYLGYHRDGADSLTGADIVEMLKTARQPQPSNVHDVILKLRQDQLLLEMDSSGKDSKAYCITGIGDAVINSLPATHKEENADA